MNDAKSNPWAEIKRLQAENANLHFLIEQANGAMAELRAENENLKTDARHLLRFNQGLNTETNRQFDEINQLKAQLAKAYGEFQSNLQIEINRTHEAMERYGEAKAQLAATEEALAQVQRESKELRRKHETQAYRATVFADTAWEAKYEAAKKVADAAVKYTELACPTGDIREQIQSCHALSRAVIEYRALIPPDVKRAEKGLAQEGGSLETAHCESQEALGER